MSGPERINPALTNPALDLNPIRKPQGPPSLDFKKALTDKLQESSSLKWSSHALQRLERRGIELTSAQENRLSEAVNRAQAKGGRSSLVLMDDLAFVVATANRTVVTALDKGSMKEHIFTNIDTAVLA